MLKIGRRADVIPSIQILIPRLQQCKIGAEILYDGGFGWGVFRE